MRSKNRDDGDAGQEMAALQLHDDDDADADGNVRGPRRSRVYLRTRRASRY